MSIKRFRLHKDKRPESRSGLVDHEAASDVDHGSPPNQSWKIFHLAPSEASSRHFSEKSQLAALKKIFREANLRAPDDQPMRFAIRSRYAQGDTEKAFELLSTIQASLEGVIMTYQPDTKLLGAENRDGISCYLDSLLFAMFARPGFFDAILYTIYDGTDSRQDLVVLLRLWVNMLRSGMLIPKDITELLQRALAQCGWNEAIRQRQQDASEAFTFIADKLDMPLVTLKMDIFHNGKEDIGNDHRFVNERLLEVSIPPDREDGKPILLEDCLELYFNTRIDVRRRLQRRATLDSTISSNSVTKTGAAAQHIETYEPNNLSGSPCDTEGAVSSTPTIMEAITSPQPASSIVRRRFIPELEEKAPDSPAQELTGHCSATQRGSYRKEVMLPAWQMFGLIPWYTQNTDGFQTAVHFSSQRPILGICLKRYSMSEGEAIRRDTKIDIPIEIALPHFIKDDSLTEDAPLYGQFKLRLQSVVCHQGKSVNRGHYIALVRGTPASHGMDPSFLVNDDSGTESDHWMKFDDLAKERITLVDIEKALMTESPYILFYQIVPVDENTDESSLPPYNESATTTSSWPASDLAKTNIGVIKHPGDDGSGGQEKDSGDAPADHSFSSVQSDTSAGKRLSRGSDSLIVKRGSGNSRGSRGSDGVFNTAIAYLSGRKSIDDSDVLVTDSNRTSFEAPNSKTKGKTSREQSSQSSDDPNAGRRSSRNFMKLNKKRLPPDRECSVM